ncbi:MAG: bZIP transcription factor [Planctomycetes bacterium]|nr:bZIP transcription factor [Planctomycetota bacterium]
MSSNRLLKFIHIASTCWFIAGSVFLMIVALREAGLHWWVIFSLSGHSGTFIFFLMLVYSFAMFRGVSRSQKIELEHPLTCSRSYLTFYDIAPFLGGAAGLTATKFTQNGFELMISATTGTLFSTFLVWILVDPAVSVVEMLLPASREHRKERITEMKELQKRIQKDNERLMAELMEMESINRKQREIELRGRAIDLARLLAEHKIGCGNVEAQVVEMGGHAWHLGGIECMRQLLEMAEDAYKEQYNETVAINHIGIWWDGIGTWRKA